MRSFKGGCLVARLTVELMSCKLATGCGLSVEKLLASKTENSPSYWIS